MVSPEEPSSCPGQGSQYALHSRGLQVLTTTCGALCDSLPSCRWRQTLILGFNSLSDLSGLPWAALASLESLDLSSNRLRHLGDVVLMTWLRRLNLENNEISPVPLELGLCTGEQTDILKCCSELAWCVSGMILGTKNRHFVSCVSSHPAPRRLSCPLLQVLLCVSHSPPKTK